MSSEQTVSAILRNKERQYAFPQLVRCSGIPAHRGNGEHLSPSTIFRWATRGVKTTRGVIRLEAVRAGGRWTSSVEAVARFQAALTAASAPADPTPGTLATARRKSITTSATLELDAALGVVS